VVNNSADIMDFMLGADWSAAPIMIIEYEQDRAPGVNQSIHQSING